MSAGKAVCWWTQNGWCWDSPPDAYVQWLADEGDYANAARRAGYTMLISGFPPEDEYSVAGSITVWQHAAHLLVERWDCDTRNVAFFVAHADIPAFRSTLLPQMMQAQAAIWQAEEMRRLRRVFTAWVRHGAGERTVDEYADRDRDERAHEAEAAARQRARNPGGIK